MASRERVEEKLRELIERLNGRGDGIRDSLADTLPDRRTLLLRVPDVDGEWWSVLEDGRMDALHEGEPETEADIRIRAESDDFIELIDGTRPLLSSYLAGRLRVDASLSDLLRLRRLLS